MPDADDMTPEEAINWLEGEAMHYQSANNSAMQTDKYRKEDYVAWKIALLIRRLTRG